MSEKYILDGRRVRLCRDLITWAEWFEKADRRVAETTVGDARVSTVFIGLDHQFGDGPPLIFETMVFGGPWAGEMDRCSTWDEAEVMHEQMLVRISRS